MPYRTKMERSKSVRKNNFFLGNNKATKTGNKYGRSDMRVNTAFNNKILYRTERNRLLGGVAGGVAEYFGIDASIIRLLFIALTIFGGFGIITYLILWVVLPSRSSRDYYSTDNIKKNIKEIRNRAQIFANDVRVKRGKGDERSTNWIALILIITGLLYLLNNFGFFRFDVFWPLILVILGLVFLFRR